MPQTSKQQGMSARDKGLIIFVIVAVLAAGGFIYRTWSQDQPQIQNAKVLLPPGSAPKLQAMKAQQAGQASGGGGDAGQDIPLNNGKSPGSGQ